MFAMLGMLLDFAWKLLVLVLVVYTIVWILKNGAGMLVRVKNIVFGYAKLGIMKTEAKVKCEVLRRELAEEEAKIKKESETSSGG